MNMRSTRKNGKTHSMDIRTDYWIRVVVFIGFVTLLLTWFSGVFGF